MLKKRRGKDCGKKTLYYSFMKFVWWGRRGRRVSVGEERENLCALAINFYKWNESQLKPKIAFPNRYFDWIFRISLNKGTPVINIYTAVENSFFINFLPKKNSNNSFIYDGVACFIHRKNIRNIKQTFLFHEIKSQSLKHEHSLRGRRELYVHYFALSTIAPVKTFLKFSPLGLLCVWSS